MTIRGKSSRKRTADESGCKGTDGVVGAAGSDERRMWSKVDLDILTKYIKANGFNGDVRDLQKLFPKFSESSLRSLLNQLKRPMDCAEEKKTAKNDASEESPASSRPRTAPIEDWIAMVININETSRVGNNIPTVLQYIAKFEDLPSTEACGGVDYSSIYAYLASLSKGNIPKQLNPPSARKVLEIIEQLKYVIGKRANHSGQFVKQHAKAPIHRVIQGEEKNQILRDRRRPKWSQVELEQSARIQSPDAGEAMKVYNKMPGLNPFNFPNSL